LVQAGLLLRRARWLCLLSEATVAFRERDMERARAVFISQGAVVERFELAHVAAVAALPARRWPALPERRRCFDIATYDRLRVLLTELQRVRGEGGEIAMRIGRHTLGSARLTPLMSDV
jgi:hypothetical protein